MLSVTEFHNLVRLRIIQIEYAFLPDENGTFRRGPMQVDFNDSSSAATQFFLRNCSGARFQLTVGPMGRSHNNYKYAGREVEGVNDAFDVSPTNGIVIEPWETVTILTNEHVTFPDSYAAIVTPRVTMTDAGFLLTTAYIDPGYEGLLRVTLLNATNYRQKLSLGEPVAQLFAFEVSGTPGVDNKKRLSRRSVFFGTSWGKILEESADPFPRRKVPEKGVSLSQWLKNTWRRARKNGNTVVKILSGLGLLSMVLASLVAYGRLDAQLQTVAELKAEIAEMRDRLPEIGSQVVVIDEIEKSLEISLGRLPTRPQSVMVELEGLNGVIVVETKLDGSGEELLLRVRLRDTSFATGRIKEGVLKWVAIL